MGNGVGHQAADGRAEHGKGEVTHEKSLNIGIGGGF
jgi:hypothetical protein